MRRNAGNASPRHTSLHAFYLIATCLALPVPAACYEFITHAALTREAYLVSALGPAVGSPCSSTRDLVCTLGIDQLMGSLGEVYLDISATETNVRSAFPNSPPNSFPDFAANKIRDANIRSGFKPRLPAAAAWLMLGAIREDDVTYDAGDIENTPQDEPGGTFRRVYNHFYDPYNDVPLTVLSGRAGRTAPDWAIDTADDWTAPDGTVVPIRGNHFSTTRAREAMWRALTLKSVPYVGSVGTLGDLPFVPSEMIATREALRTAYWATVFRSLGDIVHLVQDMAQPQHTRNDAHAGLGCLGEDCAFGHKSYFEGYVEARARGASGFTLRERLYLQGPPNDILERVALDDLNYGGYPIPRFSSYRAYFSTATKSASPTGLGLANYSNQGFYSAGTVVDSFASSVFASPPFSRGALVMALIPEGTAINAAGSRLAKGSLKLLLGTVVDSLQPGMTERSVPLASFGAFDQFMKSVPDRQSTLTHYNYYHQARLLIPRAVAYSAGMLDYFFRGRMEISPPDEGVYAVVDQKAQGCRDTCGFDKLKLKLKNTTPNESLEAGNFVAVAKFRRNKCYTPNLAGEPGGNAFNGYAACRNDEEEIVVSDVVGIASLAESAEVGLTFKFPKRIPINASDVFLQVVFRGKLGSEDDAVVVETKDIGEPAFIGFANNTDYVYDFTDNRYHALPYGAYSAPDERRSMKLRFGGPTAPVAAHLDLLTAGQHAQMAYLADKGAPTVTYEFASLRYAAFSPLTFVLPTAEFESRASTSYYGSTLPVTKNRGVYRQTYIAGTLPADATLHPCPGTAGDYCTGATMTIPLAASPVSWTIDFNN
ncbi:MAG: hypothetical protein ABI886_10685 [Betaproteobacteria bacterium]